MNIGIFGGSFDPPTSSHKAIVDDCLKRKLVDQVWVCPTFNHTDKKNIASFEQRMEMCKIMLTGWFKPVKICEYEKMNPSGRTCSLIWRLEDLYPNHKFKIIIGEDRADKIKDWLNWTMLIEEYSFIVFKREDYASFNIKHWYDKSPHIVIKNEDCWMSSTYIRHLIALECFELLRIVGIKPKLISYILKHKIYGRLDEFRK